MIGILTSTEEERAVFERLLSISGVGPKPGTDREGLRFPLKVAVRMALTWLALSALDPIRTAV